MFGNNATRATGASKSASTPRGSTSGPRPPSKTSAQQTKALQQQQTLSLSSDDDRKNKSGRPLNLSNASRTTTKSIKTTKTSEGNSTILAPPAPPSISFSDAAAAIVDIDVGSHPLLYHRQQHKTNHIVHPYADIELIAETNPSPHSVSNLEKQQQQSTLQLQQSNGLAQQATSVDPVADEDFDLSLLHVLSSGESDVHSIVSAPGDLSVHRDPFANLGLTPVRGLPRRDKAAQILGIPHRRSMEPIPAPNVPTASTSNTKSHRFSSFGSRSATGGYTNPHPTIPESEFRASGARTDSMTTGASGRNRALSGATTISQMTRQGLFHPGDHPQTPLTSLYLVAGLPKSHHAWTLADPDSVLGLQHSDGAVNKWWRPEVLGSTVSPGVIKSSHSSSANKDGAATSGNESSTPIAAALASSSASIDKRKRRRANTNATIPATPNPRDPGAGIGLSKSQVAKMLSKALKLSFTREVEIIVSTLQPPSTVHTFTFTLPNPPDRELGLPSTVSGGAGRSAADVRSSVYSAATGGRVGPMGMGLIPSARPSSTYLGPTTTPLTPAAQEALQAESENATTYYGVCLTVWSHADEERSRAIRKTMEMGLSRMNGGGESMRRKRREKADSLVPPVPSLHGGSNSVPARALRTSNPDAPGQNTPWSGTDAETEPDDQDFEGETDTGALSESDWEGRRGHLTSMSTTRGDVGGSTLFLPGDTIFWLPYALTLVSRVPIYDLMRDFLTFSWARFSKDVHSHTLQIAKILSAPIPKPGELVKLDASPQNADKSADKSGKAVASPAVTLEMICRMPGGLDFGKGLVDVNFQMWPLFCCLSLDNILTCCEIALSPTGRVLFVSKHPAMLGIAVSTIKYLVELRGWSGIALQAVHSRDAKIYLEDPGPWILGLATEAKYVTQISPEVCVCDLDINYVNCHAPPAGHVSTKARRDRYRRTLLGAFDAYFHPDHSIPSEFKEAFPAGRFRPVVRIQSRRGAASNVGTEAIKAPEWWNWTRVVGAFNEVLQDRDKPLSLFKRITSIRGPKRQAKLSPAELLIQLSLRKRAAAFVDARDDLETKIGRLSRRLNFLLTESDLWREKFVQFEAYADKLSNEAIELRNRINKEQRESRRLTSLVTLTAQEKAKLQQQLNDTETAHHAAVIELDRMKYNMDKMEIERSQMVAEVEAQIERALQSMMVGDSDMEWDEDDLDSIPNEAGPSRMRSPIIDAAELHSRPISPRSMVSSHRGASRRKQGNRTDTEQSDGGRSTYSSRVRHFGTATTLADIADKLEQVRNAHVKSRASSRHATRSRASSRHGHSNHGHSSPIPPVPRDGIKTNGEEAGDEDSLSEKERKEKAMKQAVKRFSTGAAEGGNGTSSGDGMMSAVDAGIVEQSDRIAEKMKQIQQRFETVLAAEDAAAAIEPEIDENMEPVEVNEASGSEDEEKFQPAPLTSIAPRPRPNRAARPPPTRAKSRENPSTNDPTTPTASRFRRADSGSVHASTEAWIDSVENARSEDWRESAITATNSVDQHPHLLAEDVKSGSQHDEHSSRPTAELPRLKKVASGASLSALRPSSTTPPVSANTTATQMSDSMSSGATHNYVTSKFRPESRGGITTDNDDDDFQSAYSTSPRMNGGSASELERSGSMYGGSGRRSRQQYMTVTEPNRLSLGRAPSFTSTTLSTGAVGGLGLTGTDYDSRSRASSIGTYLEASPADKGRSPSHSGSDHTVGNPEPAADSPKTRSHPPVSMANRAGLTSTSSVMPRKGSFTTPSTNLHGVSLIP